ncbi:MAG: tetratricopeptide repeat protein, partial [Acidobacteria bacterium]|nr:tetratricopeptide repeat protein [Acidobacteriota bacterium]
MLCEIDAAWQDRRDSMRSGKRRWLLVGLLCLGLWPMVAASAQETRWDSIMADAVKAYQQADYAQAEKLFLAALKEAEKFGEQDPRLATSLNNLAVLYHTQGKYAQAEPLYR